MKDRILGALIGAAAGDAMASATDGKAYEEILRSYGGEVRDFVTPDERSQAKGRKAGQFTDAFSIPYYLMEALVRADGKASKALGEQVLRDWGKSEYFAPFAGMTTRKVVNFLNADGEDDYWAFSGHLNNKLFKGHYYALSSNGSACKAYPLGLLHPGNPEKAMQESAAITMSSHDDHLSVAGACAVAAAMAVAMQGASLYEVVQAAMKGAEEGDALGWQQEDVQDYPGPSTVKRTQLAQKVACQYAGSEEAAKELRDRVGCGPEVAETVPTTLGLMIAYKDEPLEAFYQAVNIGDETCAMASLVGAFTGAMHGSAIFPASFREAVEQANGVDLGALAEQICALQD